MFVGETAEMVVGDDRPILFTLLETACRRSWGAMDAERLGRDLESVLRWALVHLDAPESCRTLLRIPQLRAQVARMYASSAGGGHGLAMLSTQLGELANLLQVHDATCAWCVDLESEVVELEARLRQTIEDSG